jgi:hypothetical protein
MKNGNNKPMNEKEFKLYTQKRVDTLGDDISGFFNIIRDTFAYFMESDVVIERTQISIEEFEKMIEEIIKVLGGKESVRFFKAVYDALPKETITYFGVMVKVFEEICN